MMPFQGQSRAALYRCISDISDLASVGLMGYTVEWSAAGTADNWGLDVHSVTYLFLILATSFTLVVVEAPLFWRDLLHDVFS